jgi:hypothetical protein
LEGEAEMSFRDKLEIGLDPDAGHRSDNLPEIEKKTHKKEGERADEIGEARHKTEPKFLPKPARRRIR